MTAPQTDPSDPFLWLEDVMGEHALAWVRQRNAESEDLLQAQPGFEALRAGIREVLDSREQIPYVSRRGDWLYNLWRDAANPRGLWRRTTLAEYRKPQPAWETVIDVDALGRAEGENWVWAGATCLGPDYRRCLVSLSRGGADAHRGARVRHRDQGASSTAASRCPKPRRMSTGSTPTPSSWAPISAPVRSPIPATRAWSSAGGAASRWPMR